MVTVARRESEIVQDDDDGAVGDVGPAGGLRGRLRGEVRKLMRGGGILLGYDDVVVPRGETEDEGRVTSCAGVCGLSGFGS